MTSRIPSPPTLQVIALVKNDERYIFIYDDDTRNKVTRTFGRFAADPGLDFTWHDAAVLAATVRAEK